MDVGRVTGSTIYTELKVEYSQNAADTVQELPYEKEQCTLDISEEGYRRWELAQQSAGGQEIAGEQQPVQPAAVPVGDTEPEPDREEKLLQFMDKYRDLYAKLKPKASKETDTEKVAAMEQLRQLEEEQEAEYRKQEAEAQEIARKQLKTRNSVEKGMRELTIMLESVKPKDEEEERDKTENTENKGGQKDRGQGTALDSAGGMKQMDARTAMQGIGSLIRNHAFREERAMDATIESIYENAQGNFAAAREEDRGLISRLWSLSDTLGQAELSEADKDEAVDQFLMDARRSLGIIGDNMGYGLERLKNLRPLHIGRRSSQNMIFADRAQSQVGKLADQTALDGLYQENFRKLESDNLERLEEYIRKLQEEERRPDTDEAKREEKEEKVFAGYTDEEDREVSNQQ